MENNCYGLTDIGKRRSNNQDSFLIKSIDEKLLIFAVCDGMGGANGGSEASSVCADVFTGYVCENLSKNEKQSYIPTLRDAVKKANRTVYKMSVSNKALEGMGTTLAACLCDEEKYYLCWVGDSRIYAFKDGVITQLSHDHSFVQTLVDSGSITEEEAKVHPNRNIITRAVGIAQEVECDVLTMDRKNVDGLLICSDGLSSYVEKEQMEKILRQETDVDKAAEGLVELANSAGGYDNITVILHRNQL